MAISQSLQNSNKKNGLFKDFPWFHDNFYWKLQKAISDFLQKDYETRFMGISDDENILFYGDEYFVNKIPATKNSTIQIKISAPIVSSFLDSALGETEKKFKLQNLTDIEAKLIKSMTLNIYREIEDYLNEEEPSKRAIINSKHMHFTYFLQENGKHLGKVIVSIPDYMLPNPEEEIKKENFSIGNFKSTNVDLNISVGSSRIALNDIKHIEDGDIIVLENSDINKMSILLPERAISFGVNPNPSLIISIDNNGGNEMEEETSVKPQNMWDSILVDIVAEFDNVKLTLGELKQISEGLVIDVGSVYDHKIKLKVENQTVAVGELVILNDRYGVRVESVKKNKQNAQAPQPQRAPQQAAPKAPQANAQPQGDENFDYSDFEIEDESI